jgi:hypothetical protein
MQTKKEPVDVLAMLDAQISSAESLQADAYWVQELPKLIAARAAVAELVEAAKALAADRAQMGGAEYNPKYLALASALRHFGGAS